MAQSSKNIPIDVAHLLPILENKLIELLYSLTPGEWELPTVAKKWRVKDVAAHLLDGNIRALSLERDRYFGTAGPENNEFDTLVNWLNRFNNDWVDAAKRISPKVMVLLHEATGKAAMEYYTSLPPFDKAVFAVDWAGEKESLNWMHVARQYTERWLHQQQIRDAVNKPGLITKELFHPFMNIFMLALPYTFRDVIADTGTSIRLKIESKAGGNWLLIRNNDSWNFKDEAKNSATTEIIMDASIAWKLFSKSIRPEEIKEQVRISGNQQYAEIALNMVAVMA